MNYEGEHESDGAQGIQLGRPRRSAAATAGTCTAARVTIRTAGRQRDRTQYALNARTAPAITPGADTADEDMNGSPEADWT